MTPIETITFSELKEGDRFRFASDKQKVVYQVTGKEGKKNLYNQVNEVGQKTWLHDRAGLPSSPVIFIRNVYKK